LKSIPDLKRMNVMNKKKLEKKRQRLLERIDEMELEMQNALTKKTSDVKEINVPELTTKLAAMRKELSELKIGK